MDSAMWSKSSVPINDVQGAAEASWGAEGTEPSTAANNVDNNETAAYQHLRRGFQEVVATATTWSHQRQQTSTFKQQQPPQQSQTVSNASRDGSSSANDPLDNRRVLVSFLDPGATTSISSMNTSPGNYSALSPAARQHHQQQQQHHRRLSLNERFQRIFQTVYHNRINAVPYQDARSKVSQTIPYIQVNCRFLESQIDLLQTPEDEINEQGEVSSSAITNAWHSRPYCYVYFVTGCPSVEEYRTKVKPAIQIFLSQLDDLYQRQSMQLSMGGGPGGGVGGGGGPGSVLGADAETCPSFLLVYCPTRTPGSPPILPEGPLNIHQHMMNHLGGVGSVGGGGGVGDAAGVGAVLGGGGDSSSGSAAQRLASFSSAFRAATAARSNFNDDAAFVDTNSTATTASETTTSYGDATMNPGGGTTTTTPGGESAGSPSQHVSSFNPSVVLTKVEKEVLRRLVADFPHGTVATITTLANDYHSFVSYGNNANLRSALEELERNEWAALLSALSKTIVHGFDNTCQRLWASLRKIGNSHRDHHGNLGHYFLVKESLAFTYRQMNLPAEALLQYSELRAFLPDLKKMHAFQHPPSAVLDHDVLAGIVGLHNERQRKIHLPPAVPIWDVTNNATSITRGFREGIRTLHYEEYYKFASAVELYLWERETSLLFQIGHTVQVLNLTLQFLVALWDYESKQQRSLRTGVEGTALVEDWAFSFAWDVRRATQEYLLYLEQQEQTWSSSSNHSGGGGGPSQPQQSASSSSLSAPQRAMTAELFGRQLSEIMAFARSRLHCLEDTFHPVASTNQRRIKYKDISKPWDPWTPATTASMTETSSGDETALSTVSPSQSSSDWSLSLNGKTFLQQAFQGNNNGNNNNGKDYLSFYMDAMTVLIHINNFCGRHRSAARFTMEMVDLHLERGNVKEAAQALQSVAKVYGRDGWGACHFLVHFRLAGFRRRGGGTTSNDATGGVSPREYLATLVHCFSRFSDGSSDSVAPQKALELLCQDFEAAMAVLSSTSSPSTSSTGEDSGTVPSTASGLYTNSPIFDVNFRLPNAKKRKQFSSQRKLPRKVFSVGDTVKITVGINSHLPREIGGIVLSASLVPHKAYLAAQNQKRPVPPKDIFHTIELPTQVEFSPGENEFELQWTPMISGQFVLSQVTVRYKSANFVYSNDKMKELGFWLDILPVEPSQSLVVTPLFLVPGHRQRLQLEFRSGKDHVEGGELSLVCTAGLALLPPQNDDEKSDGEQWANCWNGPLKECPRGQSQTFSVIVAGSESADELEITGTPSVQIKVTTKFRHGNQDQSELFHENNESASAHFLHEMEAIVPTIANSALTVENVFLKPYSDSKAILTVTAKCHVPAPFVLKNWNLVPPSYLKHDPAVAASDFFNSEAKDISLIDGESIRFAFDCFTLASNEAVSTTDPQTQQQPMLVAELQDEHGGTFLEKLPLRVVKPTALAATAKLPQVHDMVANVKSSHVQGDVGIPIQLTYSVDITPFMTQSWNGCIYYNLDTKNDAWLIIGPTQGSVVVDAAAAAATTVPSKGWQLSLDVIPTNPGVLSTLPSLTFTFTEGGGASGKPFSMTIPIVWEQNEFQAMVPLKHSIVAFPEATI